MQAYECNLIQSPELARLIETRRTADEPAGRLLQVEDADDLFADRFSILHLLPASSFASLQSAAGPSPPSDDGAWSELSDGEEDRFFLSGDEAEDIERHFKRRRLEESRSARMAALSSDSEDGEDGEEETPAAETKLTPEILAVMRHTAQALKSSPNPDALRLRILANQGSTDPRFAFLRGRVFGGVWEALRAGKTVSDDGEIVVPVKAPAAALVAYGSDSEDEDENEQPEVTEMQDAEAVETKEEVTPAQDEEAQAKRREKARLWALKRKKPAIDDDV